MKIRGSRVSSPSCFNAIHAFNMRFRVSQKHDAILQCEVSRGKLLHRVRCLAFETNFFRSKIEKIPRGIRGEKSSKDMGSSRNLVSTIGAQASPTIQPLLSTLRQIFNDIIRIQKLHQLWYHCQMLLLFIILYHLFNKIQRKVYSRSRVATI